MSEHSYQEEEEEPLLIPSSFEFRLADDPAVEGVLLSEKEQVNERFLERGARAAQTMGSSRGLTIRDFITVIRTKLYAAGGKDITALINHHHSKECGHGLETRVLITLTECAWRGDPESIKAIAELCDQLINQWCFFRSDCCIQEALTSRADGVLDQMCLRLLELTAMQRQLILCEMRNTKHLAESMKALLMSSLFNEEPASSSSGPSSSAQPIVGTVIPVITEMHCAVNDSSLGNVLRFVRKCVSAGQNLRLSAWHKRVISDLNKIYGHRHKGRPTDEWQEWSATRIVELLESYVPDKSRDPTLSPVKQYDDFLTKNTLRLHFDRAKVEYLAHPAMQEISEHEARFEKVREAGGVSEADDERLSKRLIKELVITGISEESLKRVMTDLKARVMEPPVSVVKTLKLFDEMLQEGLQLLKAAEDFIGDGGKKTPYPNANKRAGAHLSQRDQRRRRTREEGEEEEEEDDEDFCPFGIQPGLFKTKKAKKSTICHGCGWTLKKSQKTGKQWCPRDDGKGCSTDYRRNKHLDEEWADSQTGKKWAALGYQFLPKDTTTILENAPERKKAATAAAAAKKTEGKYAYMIDHCKTLLLSQELIPFGLLNVQATRKRKTSARSAKASDEAPAPALLLDTGAIGSCVVSDVFLSRLEQDRIKFNVNDTCHELNTAMNHNTITNKEISFNIYLKSEQQHAPNPLVVPIRAIVAPIGVDLIIDKLTIKQHNLLQHFPSHFAEGNLLDRLQQLPAPKSVAKATGHDPPPARSSIVNALHTKQAIAQCTSWTARLRQSSSIPHHRWVQGQRASAYQMIAAKNTHELMYARSNKPISFLATLIADNSLPMANSKWNKDDYSYLANLNSNFSRKPAFEREGNLIGIPDNKLESIPAELISDVHSENEYKKVSIEGPPLLQNKLRALVEEFSDIFKTTVQGTPAKLKPFKLEVDSEKWEQPANMLRCRNLDRERSVELDKMVKVLIEAKVVEPCNDAYYSHAFLVPKSNGHWRLVLDFKNLNGATVNHYSWPIPDIKEMLNRVGDSQPEFFAVFDLTSGYYQAPIDEDSRKYTAFLTRHGVYRWLRLPMGLTNAGSYFQHSLATQVLNGLIHNGAELYLDDCLVHAKTEDEYIKRLRTVFLRFRESGITLNPSKCKLGLSQVEFVGHTVNKDGLHFTRDKLDSVLNFPQPGTKRQIKSFIGLANYFRDHIRNHSDRVQALQELVGDYDKSQARHKIKWSDECIRAFEDIRQAIDECPMLWFLDDFSPIYLQTDASDYGIGAYLYQVITLEDGTTMEHPVGFLSKSIASSHQSWDTPMKEGFAIFYALKKWEYLLRDRQFTVMTDHENLTRLRADHDTNKMVKRWFMAFQEFDITWEWVKGVNNDVPDTFSRLCKEEPDEHPAVLLCQLTGYEIPQEHWDTIARFHNSGLKVEGRDENLPPLPGGHGGVERTLQQLDLHDLQWKHRTKHVRRFIKMCPCCQKMDQMKKVIHSYPFTVSSYGLWDTVSIDFIERLQPDEYGNNMIIVIIDNFSRFVDLYPTNSTKAEGAADALLSFVGRYATPLHFTTDGGSNFKSNLIRGLIERLGSDHYLTAAYSKEQNAIVERMNKEVIRHLSNIIFDKRIASKWSKYCPIVQRVINTSKNAATGLTPAEIVFPNGVQLDRSLLTESSSIYVSSYIQEMQYAQGRIIAIAEASLREKDEAHIANYSPQHTEFENGSYVLAEHRHNSLRRGPKSKLLPFLKGPLQVKNHNAEDMYALQDLVSQEIKTYHVSRLRPFLYDERTLTPLQAAVTDSLDEFVAERVIRMRGNTRRSRRELEFQIRWAGYGPADDTWEPWDACRDSYAVQNYLRAHADARVRRLAKPIEAVPEDASDESEGSDNER